MAIHPHARLGQHEYGSGALEAKPPAVCAGLRAQSLGVVFRWLGTQAVAEGSGATWRRRPRRLAVRGRIGALAGSRHGPTQTPQWSGASAWRPVRLAGLARTHVNDIVTCLRSGTQLGSNSNICGPPEWGLVDRMGRRGLQPIIAGFRCPGCVQHVRLSIFSGPQRSRVEPGGHWRTLGS